LFTYYQEFKKGHTFSIDIESLKLCLICFLARLELMNLAYVSIQNHGPSSSASIDRDLDNQSKIISINCIII